ncbi:MAG TPA: putative Ig domain-containing protein, partial [Blastocatellia bacterium]|nr:putative Ig domain-containing protein [Blastocatellia bacterium]
LISTDFSGGIPPGWVVAHGGTGFYPGGQPATWTTANPCNRVIPSPFAPPFAIVDSQCAVPPATQDESLITPPFDATGQGQVVLRFDNQFRWFSGGDNEIGDVDVTTDDGRNWINVLRFQGGDDGFPTPTVQNLNLTPFIAGNPPNVRVRFHYYVTAAPLLARHKPVKPNIPVGQELSWGIDRPAIVSFTIGPTNRAIGQNGGTGQVAIEAATSVPWTAESHVPWIQLLAGAGVGAGSVGYEVMPNLTGAPRFGTATIANNTFTILQDGSCLTITVNPTTLPGGTAGMPYQQTLTANGGLGPYVFATTAGSLPNGLTLSPNGVLTGTPTAFGTFNFTAGVTDASNCTGTRNYELVISAGCAVTVSPSGLLAGTVGAAYNQTLTANGGTAPYSFSLSAGSLPGGLSLSAGGALTGMPTMAGNFTFTVRATDSSPSACTGDRQYTVTISPPGNGLQFFPLPQPVRLLETRAGLTGCTTPGAIIDAGSTFTLPARTTCAGIPANAQAVTGNITVAPTGGGFLTLFPSTAAQPTVANSNFGPNEVTNNVFTVGLGAADGAFKIFASGTTHVIVDVTGYYAPPALSGGGGLYFHPLATPVRLLETRAGLNGCFAPGAQLIGTGDPNSDPNQDFAIQGRSPVASPCNSIPASAQMLVGNATSVVPDGGGYLTIYPSGGTRPLIASSNYSGSDVINGPFTVKLGADGKFKIYTLRTTHLVVDIIGYYSEEAVDASGVGLLFNPLPIPVRLLETRPGGPPLVGCTRTNAPIQGNLNAATHTQPAAGFCGLPTSAQAVVGNASVVSTPAAGFLTLFPGNLTIAPLVATSNYPTPAASGYNRHIFVGLSPVDGTFKVLTSATTDLILDASGYFAP